MNKKFLINPNTPNPLLVTVAAEGTNVNGSFCLFESLIGGGGVGVVGRDKQVNFVFNKKT